VLPFVTTMISASLREGRLPPSHRHAVVTPLLKSSRLDADELKNYRPISNLSFISKLTERAVSTRLVSYLNENGMMPRLQSADRCHHSTETALVKVLSDIFAAVDQQQVMLLGLLDLSTASTVSTVMSGYSDYDVSLVSVDKHKPQLIPMDRNFHFYNGPLQHNCRQMVVPPAE